MQQGSAANHGADASKVGGGATPGARHWVIMGASRKRRGGDWDADGRHIVAGRCGFSRLKLLPDGGGGRNSVRKRTSGGLRIGRGWLGHSEEIGAAKEHGWRWIANSGIGRGERRLVDGPIVGCPAHRLERCVEIGSQARSVNAPTTHEKYQLFHRHPLALAHPVVTIAAERVCRGAYAAILREKADGG